MNQEIIAYGAMISLFGLMYTIGFNYNTAFVTQQHMVFFAPLQIVIGCIIIGQEIMSKGEK